MVKQTYNSSSKFAIARNNRWLWKCIGADHFFLFLFLKPIKVEWIYSRSYNNQQQVLLSNFQWLESWYDRKRRLSAFGYKTIDEFVKINSNF